MKKIYSLLVMLLCVTMASAYTSPYNDLGKTLNQSFKVKGGIGIKQFALALGDLLPIEWELAEVDEKNGYICESSEGDGGYFVNMAVWNRNDGKKLLVVSYHISESVDADAKAGQTTPTHFSFLENNEYGTYLCNIGYQAYLYDAAAQMLRPTSLDVEGENWHGMGDNPFILLVPKEGKDLQVEILYGETSEGWTLRWNGMGWIYEDGVAIGVFIHDKTYPVNVRNKPKGDVVATLQENDMIQVDRCENGWFHVNAVFFNGNEEADIHNYRGEKWVHHSVVLAKWSEFAAVMLKAMPTPHSETVYESKEDCHAPNNKIVAILDMQDGMVKVTLANGKTGWAAGGNLCGDPQDTCQ